MRVTIYGKENAWYVTRAILIQSGQSGWRKGAVDPSANAEIQKGKTVLKPLLILSVLVILSVLTGYMLDEIRYRIDLHEYPRDYAEYVEKAADAYSIPAEILFAVIHTESSFRKDAVSPKGAVGLMQLTPDTYDWICFLRREEAAPDITDPSVNIDAGAFLLHYLYQRMGIGIPFMQAINAVIRASHVACGRNGHGKRKTGQYPYPETKEYVRR